MTQKKKKKAKEAEKVLNLAFQREIVSTSWGRHTRSEKEYARRFFHRGKTCPFSSLGGEGRAHSFEKGISIGRGFPRWREGVTKLPALEKKSAVPREKKGPV